MAGVLRMLRPRAYALVCKSASYGHQPSNSSLRLLLGTTTAAFRTRWLSSQADEAPAAPGSSTPVSPSSHNQEKRTSSIPGLAVAAGVMGCSHLLADPLGHFILSLQSTTETAAAAASAPSPISAIPVAVLLGMLLRNSGALPESLSSRLGPGLSLATTTVLRAGIISVGIKLSLAESAALGAAGIPAVTLAVGTGLVVVRALGRLLGLPDKQSTLVAAGTAICGVTAITAVSPAIKASQRDQALAIANVVAFGTMGMLAYPYLAHMTEASSAQIGTFLGLAIHDTSQVMGAALTYSQVYADPEVLKVAAVTKLTRNLFLAGVVPYFTYKHAQSASPDDPPKLSLSSVKKFFPLFVAGFIGMSCFRTAGDVTMAMSQDHTAFYAIPEQQWKDIISTIGGGGTSYLLCTAMAAVGLSTKAESLRGVGFKPFALGLAGCATVAAAGATGAYLVPFLSS